MTTDTMPTTSSIPSSTLTVVRVESGDDLWHRYPGQHSPQPCYVSLDCEEGVLRASYSPHVGGGRSLAEHHHRALRWKIPTLTVSVANDLLNRIAPLAQRVVAGYATRFDGHNFVGVFNDDARDAEEDIDAMCWRDWQEYEVQRRWEASDYFASISRRELLADTGLTAATTDEQLEAIVATEKGRVPDGSVVEGISEYLSDLRDELRDAEDAEDDAR